MTKYCRPYRGDQGLDKWQSGRIQEIETVQSPICRYLVQFFGSQKLFLHAGIFISSRLLEEMEDCLHVDADAVLIENLSMILVMVTENGGSHFLKGSIGDMVWPLYRA